MAYRLESFSLASRGVISPTSSGYCLAPFALASVGVIVLAFEDADQGMADPTARYREPWDRGYYLWKYGKPAQRPQLKPDEPEPERPNVMAQMIDEAELNALELQAAAIDRDIRELAAYEANLEALIAQELIDSERQAEMLLANKQAELRANQAMVEQLEQNMRQAREAMVLALEARRRHQNLIAAISEIIRQYF